MFIDTSAAVLQMRRPSRRSQRLAGDRTAANARDRHRALLEPDENMPT